MILYHTSTQTIETPDTLHSREHLDFGKDFAGIITRDQALDQLRFAKPNHQVCLTSQKLIDTHLHFVTSEQL